MFKKSNIIKMFNEFYKKARKNVYGNYLKYKEKPY